MFIRSRFPLSAVLGLATAGALAEGDAAGAGGGNAPPPAGGAGAAPPPPAPPPPPPPADDQNLPWLAGRLERERNSAAKTVLKDLGVEDPKDAKAALDELKKRRDAEKSDLQKANDRVKELEPVTVAHKAALDVLTARLAAERKTLTPEQAAAVDRIAGDDPVKQLGAIDTLRPTWVKAPDATTATATTTTQVQNTAPPRGTPATGGAGGTVDHKAIYKQLANDNPIAAAAYANQHAREIYTPKT